MLLSLIAAAAWIPALIGLGSLLAAGIDEDLRPAVAGFGGLAALGAAAMAVNLVFPIGSGWPLAFLVSGWAAFLVLRNVLLPARALELLPGVTLVVLACAALTQFPLRGGKGFDAGLYHLQAVQWIAKHRQPPGLANLSGFLGYDVSWFAVAAALEVPGLTGRSSFVLNGLPILFAAWASLAGLRRLAAGDLRFGNGFLAAMAVPACLALESLAFPGYDDPVTLVSFLSLALWAMALEREAPSRGPLAVGAFLLAAFAATIKLSAAVVAVGSLAGLLLVRGQLRRTQWTIMAGAAAALLVPWVLRGLLLSGCLAYPASSTCFPRLPWAVSRQSADGVAATIVNFARAPPIEQAGFLAPVARVIPYFGEAGRLPLLALVALTLAAGLFLLRGDLRLVAAGAPSRFVLAVSGAGALFWAVTAPNPRFGVTYLLPLALTPLASALTASPASAPGRRARATLLALAALFAVAAGGWTLRLLRWEEVAILRWPAFPEARVERVVTSAGLEVNVPVGSIQCWTAPLPCTPFDVPDLAWRGMFVIPRR